MSRKLVVFVPELPADESVSEQTRADHVERMYEAAAKIRAAIVKLRTEPCDPRELPRRRDKLNARLRAVERELLEDRQREFARLKGNCWTTDKGSCYDANHRRTGQPDRPD